MAYQWQDYNQQYQGWNPHMMMNSQGMTNSSSQSLHPQTSNTISTHSTTQQLHIHVIRSAHNRQSTTTTTTTTKHSQRIQHATATVHLRTNQTISTSSQGSTLHSTDTSDSTTASSYKNTATSSNKQTHTHTHSNSNTSDITDSSTTHTYTNSHTNNTNILTHITTCGTNQGNHFRQMDSYRRLL